MLGRCLKVTLTAMALLLAAEAVPGSSHAGAVPTDRVVIRYTNGLYELVSSDTVVKVLPPCDELPAGDAGVTGFWYELQSATGQVRYRKILRDPVQLTYEWPSNGRRADGAPMRASAAPAARVFSLVVPQATAGDQLVLFGSPEPAGGRRSAAAELTRIPLAAGGQP